MPEAPAGLLHADSVAPTNAVRFAMSTTDHLKGARQNDGTIDAIVQGRVHWHAGVQWPRRREVIGLFQSDRPIGGEDEGNRAEDRR